MFIRQNGKTVLIYFAALFFAGSSSYAEEVQPSFRGNPSEEAVSETEEVVSDLEVLPAEEEDGDQVVSLINKTHEIELSLSQEEIRNRFNYGVTASLGGNSPWQAYTVQAGSFFSRNLFIGLFGGSGKFSKYGQIDDQKTHDIEFNTNSFGFYSRYFPKNLSPVSFKAMISYATWSGTVDPRGSDSTATPTNAEKLASSFDASGLAFGLSAVIGGVWDNGLFIDWTPIGLRVCKITSQDLSNDTEDIKNAISSNIEKPGLYGIANIAFGYYF